MIAWFAKNPVAANLMMFFIIFAGGVSMLEVNIELPGGVAAARR